MLNARALRRWSTGSCPVRGRRDSQPRSFRPPAGESHRRLSVRSARASGRKFVSEKLEKFWRNLFITSFSKLGHPVARWTSVRSVIWLHSSRSIRSKYLQLCNGIKIKVFETDKMKISPCRALQSQCRWTDDIQRLPTCWDADWSSPRRRAMSRSARRTCWSRADEDCDSASQRCGSMSRLLSAKVVSISFGASARLAHNSHHNYVNLRLQFRDKSWPKHLKRRH